MKKLLTMERNCFSSDPSGSSVDISSSEVESPLFAYTQLTLIINTNINLQLSSLVSKDGTTSQISNFKPRNCIS